MSDTGVRLAREFERAGFGGGVLSSPAAVAYAARCSLPIETGPSPFSGGPALAIVGSDGRVALVRDSTDAAPAACEETVTYAGMTAADPEDHLANYVDAVRSALDLVPLSGRVAVEEEALPLAIASLLSRARLEWTDATAAIARARAVKLPFEIELLRAAASTASTAQRAAVRIARPGMSEIELFGAVRAAAEIEAGERCAFAGDLVSGVEGTAGIGGWPGSRTLRTGDLVMADLAPRVGGYWADSCNTFVLGRATHAQRRLHDAVAHALHTAETTAGPGIAASVVDAAVRRDLARHDLAYPHHTGHGIGTSVHEWPRIIPGERALLEPGMVILLEPGAYLPGVGGVRLEHLYLVTGDGLERLTDFDQQLEPGSF
ncbi:M24 family metallopeptidase [Leifsonia naganoensis]|uniref:Xaa-Pro aminopeptidase n=1 Tax=Leifsonia naganoensis TaxID=150025 RepID=A0A853DMP1_9MICO|nr:Xaa-Pro peptidase family protein [Leifsonia naganoensis]NYK09557.1 Xaa-Pro aminopeptidase [Leifsonia naganoensis]